MLFPRIAVFAAAFFLLPLAQAQTPLDPMDTSLSAEARGKAVAEEAYLRDRGFGDEEATLTMNLQDARGRERSRQMRFRTLERDNEGDWMIAVFDNPADVRGTASLTHSKALEPDDQWLFLPATNRVRRIASNNKSTPFMGSEFSFEDLSDQQVEKYSYKYLREEACGELTCHVVEQYPAYEHSGYSRLVMWYDNSEYRTHKVEYYDRRERLLKTLTMTEYSQFLDKYWRPMHLEMLNHQTSNRTLLTYSGYKFRVGFSERDFDVNALRNIR